MKKEGIKQTLHYEQQCGIVPAFAIIFIVKQKARISLFHNTQLPTNVNALLVVPSVGLLQQPEVSNFPTEITVVSGASPRFLLLSSLQTWILGQTEYSILTVVS